MWIRFGRFRFREGQEATGLEGLRKHVKTIAAADGCRSAWLAQGQHPSTEFIVVALFDSEDAILRLEGRLRSDPELGGDFFALLRFTTQPPEVAQYEVRD
jgi:hypothetical protein